MDNALASKDALNLSLGVALTGAQVGALTHDIVWMENRVVEGQSVLVPTLYLAQVDARNVRGSSLIQGRDLNLISGGDLVNVGTLRASRDLSVSSGGSIYQGGLVEAGNNLQLIAQDSIRNAMAGQIRGENVSLAAVRGDVTNERTAIQVRDGAGYRTVTDAGSGVSARQDLAVSAGRDVTNYGALQAGRDVALQAGNDVNLLAKTDGSEKHEIFKGGHRYVVTTQAKQLSSTVDAGRDLDIQAGRDINVLASQANAGQDLRLGAGQDINVTSAAEVHNVETRIRDGKKRITEANDQSTQLASALTAGRDLRTEAGRDTTLVASKISAGNEAYLVSGNQLSLVAAQDSTHTLYDMKEKGNWGAKKAQRDEVTQTTQVGTEIRTGGNLTLRSGGDQLYQVAKLNSGNDLNLQSGGAITFEGVKDLHDESHTKSKSNLAWFSMKGKGNTDETLRQSELLAQGQTVIQAVQGLKIDVKHVDQQTVSQTIDAMVDAEPQLAWLKEAEQRGDVDWRQVKELHESFKYDNSGMGQAAMLAVIIIVTVVTAGGASALAASAGSAVGAGSTMAAASAATGASAGLGNVMATAALTSMASTGAVSFINNKGNLSLAAKDTFSSNSLKNATVGALTAGLINYADSTWFQGASPAEGAGAQVTTAGPVQNPGYSEQWLSWDKAQDALARSGTHAVIESGVSTAINGGSLKENLGTALVSQGFDLAAAMGNKQLGDFADYLDLSPGSAEKIFLHAMLGGALSAARGGDFKTGALAAGAAEGLTGVASENLGKYIDTRFMTDDQFRVATAQIIGIAAGSLVDGNPNDSAWVAGNVERYNEQLHRETVEKIEQESGRYAQENQISRPEAEKRLAQAAQYYSDADWRAVMLKNGYVPDEAALDYLGEILAPTGSYYAERQTPKGASLEPGRQYTAQETAALLRDFEFNNPGAFSDTSINAENFVGFAQGDLGNGYKRFYERTLKVDSSWSDWSLGNAIGATQGMSASVRGLQNTVSGIANDPVGALKQFANGVGYFAQYPLTTIGNGWESLVEKGGLSQAYALQGRHELAGAVAAEQLTDFGIGLIPGERLLALGKVGGATNALDGLVWHDAALGAKANVGSISHISGVNLPKSQSKMIADFEAAGYPKKPVVSPTSGNVVGTQYILPDGSRVRVMQADGRSPQRASFENANGGPVDPTTGKPPQPPQGLSKAERKQWIRERTHIEQVD